MNALKAAGATVFMTFVVIACTNDFDAFEAKAGDATQDSSTSGNPDGSNEPVDSGKFGSIGDSAPPPDGAPPSDASFDAPEGCQQSAASCISQKTTCFTNCQNTYNTCAQPCNPGNPGKDCRDACANTRTLCQNQCVSTCQTCAGAKCIGVCT
jgi:hypothetical protein